jgi:hypothetical protein
MSRARLRSGLVRILGAVAGPAPSFLRVTEAKLPQGGTTGAETIGHDFIRPTMSLPGFPRQYQRGFLVPGLCHEALEHFAFVINGPPLAVLLTVDLHKDHVQVPSPAARPQSLHLPLFGFPKQASA